MACPNMTRNIMRTSQDAVYRFFATVKLDSLRLKEIFLISRAVFKPPTKRRVKTRHTVNNK
ncbi:MAG TPA: hypothetical protein DET40_09505 [Lentisphaeria bacterium]|nr:MAG: hypothetical protein A2X45_08295 [Lentisphaerae bacterium GWF2_50_93]HCE43772.1 hypothetical protein [Lentisphaeria bacterium]